MQKDQNFKKKLNTESTPGPLKFSVFQDNIKSCIQFTINTFVYINWLRT